LSKIEAIHTHETLLATFVRSLDEQEGVEPQIRAALRPGGGAELRLEVLNEKFQFAVRPYLNPSRKVLSQDTPILEKGLPVILLCPHIPDELGADYRKKGLSHADLNGRLFIKTDRYLLDRQPRKRIYRNPVSEPDLFSLKTSRIIRAFLSRREKDWTQEELGEHTKLSPGLISRILKTLVTHGYAKREKASPGIKSRARYHLQEFDRLLDAWRAGDDWRKRTRVQQYSALNDDVRVLAGDVRDALGEKRVFYTQWFAANLRHPYTNSPLVSAYFKGENAPELPFARKVQTGGNLWLIIPADKGVLFDVQQVQGFNLVSDVQIYLDLLPVSQRGPDQAEALRQWEGFAR
jgi:DNA-binding MarR family transcriptional regulator